MNLSFHIEVTGRDEFFDHWSKRYYYDYDDLYTRNIGEPLTDTSLLELFMWKNGGKLSRKKADSVRENYPVNFSGDVKKRYLDYRQSGGAIWNIFYLHCLDSSAWPIFDQHTYRAMKYLQTGRIMEIGTTKKQKYHSYCEEYLPFLRSLDQSDMRKTDKALFAFGQFLKLAKKYV